MNTAAVAVESAVRTVVVVDLVDVNAAGLPVPPSSVDLKQHVAFDRGFGCGPADAHARQEHVHCRGSAAAAAAVRTLAVIALARRRNPTPLVPHSSPRVPRSRLRARRRRRTTRARRAPTPPSPTPPFTASPPPTNRLRVRLCASLACALREVRTAPAGVTRCARYFPAILRSDAAGSASSLPPTPPANRTQVFSPVGAPVDLRRRSASLLPRPLT